jgi:LDH2 family malate/lactate/ureidoglycolate dehydrogenase
MSSTNAQRMQHVSASDARSFVQAVLIGNGVAEDNASVVARCLVEADLRGVDTHGMWVALITAVSASC